MLRAGFTKVVVALTACLALALVVSACGGGSSSSSSSSSSGSEATPATGAETEGGNSAVEEEGGGAETAALKEDLAPYIGQPSAFPTSEKLKEVPKGATVAYMDCGTPTCALSYELLEPAAQAMGVKLTRIKAGSAANTVSEAFDTVIAQKPDAVIVNAINMELWKKQAKELQEAGIPMVTSGVIGTEPYGIEGPNFAEPESSLTGRLMADYVAAEIGDESNAVIYNYPELPFSPIIVEAFTEELESVCPGCSVRSVDIPATALGNTAPNEVISDLQANPETTVAVFATDEGEIGLPTALKAAGIDVKTIGSAPEPTNLQYLKEGKETAALALDFPVLVWTFLDQAARGIVGQKQSGPEAEGLSVQQFLTKEDITFDPAKGWTGYPDFAEKFSKLWGVEG
jgi:ribose transport system substrate-binding protein